MMYDVRVKLSARAEAVMIALGNHGFSCKLIAKQLRRFGYHLKPEWIYGRLWTRGVLLRDYRQGRNQIARKAIGKILRPAKPQIKVRRAG